jgi:glycyl-tRNA synthetase beta chain
MIKKNNVLLEVSVENVPSRFIPDIKKQIYEKLSELLKTSRLEYGEIKVCATSRRFVIYIKDVPPKTEKVVEKIYGPLAKYLKDESGNYTKMAVGFAKAHGVDVKDLKVESVEKKGEVICAVKVVPSISATKILGDVFVNVIKSLVFPKNMIWEESKFVFARPIRNILALYGTKLIPIEIAGVKSSKTTFSSYFTGFKRIKIKNADDYFRAMEKNYVAVDDEKRKNLIIKILEGVESYVGCCVLKDEDTIEENLYLVEYPSGVVVKYPVDFLKLPPELINLVMKRQLKFFSCADEKGNLIPVFVGIRDGFSKGNKNVESGYLNVFKARCADAVFFYDMDLKTKPDVFEGKIKNIIFHKELGSIYDKKLRVKDVISKTLKDLNIMDDKIINAADYLYLDLGSNVVSEFVELEGVMNYYYSENYGITDEVLKKAISQIYLPSANNDNLPDGVIPSVFAVSHKIDTIVGFFILNQIPTGSADPYGLRRNAIGIFRIINENKINLNLLKLIRFSYESYPQSLRNRKKIEILEREILDFIYQRIESYYVSRSITPDIIKSVRFIFLREGDILRIRERISTLSLVKNREDFKVIAFLYKRLKNITGDFKNEEVDENLFEKEEEKRLYKKHLEIETEIKKYLEENNYIGAINLLVGVSGELEEFFKNVFVMVDDEKIRNNRLSLLKKIYNLFDDIGDISQISY